MESEKLVPISGEVLTGLFLALDQNLYLSDVFPPLHFNVLMQPKAMKHSILSMYIDIYRVVLTMYVVWKSSLRETGS